jgi:hypothetical protein
MNTKAVPFIVFHKATTVLAIENSCLTAGGFKEKVLSSPS